MPFTVYQIIDTNSQEVIYVGQTARQPSDRFKEHMKTAK